ncbi:MAG: paraquat-inducible protein A [Pseudomonadota bacterium]
MEGGDQTTGSSRSLTIGLVVAATVALVAGLVLPVIEMKAFFIFSDRYSILEVVVALLDEREFALAALVFAVAVVFPVAKLAALGIELTDRLPALASFAHRLNALGRWSMLDVLLVALIVFAAKTSGWQSATTLPGLYFFAASVVLTLVAARRLNP